VSVLLPYRPTRWLLPLASVGYVATLGLWVDGAAEPRAWVVGLAALVLAWVGARRATGAGRALGWGAAVVVASLGAVGESRGLSACGDVGAAVCVVAACVAVARVPSSGGVVPAVRVSPSGAVALAAAAWWAALVARMAPERDATAWMTEHARAWSFAASLAGAAALLALVEWSRLRRRFELGVVERAVAMRGLVGVTCAAALVVGLVGRAHPDAVARAFAATVGVVLGAAALARDPVRVARVTRRVVVLAIVGGGVALLGASAADGRSWGVALGTAVVVLAVGAVAPLLEAPLRPARGAWLDAFALAAADAGRGDPDEAIRAALHALRAPGGPAAASPELWTFSPTRVTTVDAAGYAREHEAEMPAALVLVAGAEPEATLRADVLEALEVRRPDLRPLAAWMSDHGSLLAAVIACDGEAEGVLLLPRVAREEPVTLEEIRALKATADRLAAACRARGTQARMLARAHEAMLRADAAEERVEKLRHERALDVGRDALAASRLARPATVGVYSVASRMALEALERRTAVGAPVAIVAPSGVDPVPYLARAHLAGARREGPLVLVDATSAREHDVARWTDPAASPLGLADRGMLVLLDGAALPPAVQGIVARALAEKRAPWERPASLDVQLAFTAVAPPPTLVGQGRLEPALAARLGDAADASVVLPRLRERPEDLRAILTDRLAREGMRVLGRPAGIDQAAYARLVDHGFPGEDAELASIVQRLVERLASGGPRAAGEQTPDVVRAADVDALGLGLEPAHPRKDPLSA
jgi:DNA-binding NtrC family response regulator